VTRFPGAASPWSCLRSCELAAFLESLPLGGIGKLGAQSVPPGSSWRRRRARRDGRKRTYGGVGCRGGERAVRGGEVVVVAVVDGRYSSRTTGVAQRAKQNGLQLVCLPQFAALVKAPNKLPRKRIF
jgi:hypothetical protein